MLYGCSIHHPPAAFSKVERFHGKHGGGNNHSKYRGGEDRKGRKHHDVVAFAMCRFSRFGEKFGDEKEERELWDR